MYKMLRFAFPLILAAFVLSGCRRQPPTPTTDSAMGSGSEFGKGNDLIPDGMNSDWGNNGDLELRDGDAGIDLAEGTYNGRPMVRGVLQDVYFGFDSSSISPSERSKLQSAADHLASNPSDGLLIEGYCDWYGTEDYNLALGDRRANSARDYLATLGVSTDRIDTLSKGSLEATAGLSKSESGQDRRDELIILK
jgi:peptidoglycan-associated lipoprotein